jgi:ketosteroid isomerase-like protein
MRRLWRDFLDAWEDVRASPDEIIDAGDRVLVLTRFHGRGKTSGVPLEHMPAAAVFTVGGGKVTRLALYTSRSKALEAVGLRE